MSPLLVFAPVLLATPATFASQRNWEPFLGRWDLTIQTQNGPRPAWFEVEPSGNFVLGRFVGAFGSVRPVEALQIEGDTIRFHLPRQWERADIDFEATLAGGRLIGELKSERRISGPIVGERAPTLKREHPRGWQKPIRLFDQNSLAGWKTGPETKNWTVKDGLLTNAGGGGNLVSERVFTDFRLVAEFRYPPGSNSGIYLRGRYEVQIEDGFGHEPNRHGPGAIYGFFVPSTNAAKAPGEWQRFEIELVGRTVTVIYNGERVLDRQSIPGITGGALDSEEANPGPIYLQGDHGPIEFRKLEISPAK